MDVHRMLEQGTNAFFESLDYFPALEDYNTGPDRYLQRLERAKAHLSIPVIASLNAASAGGWVRYAKLLEDAGADALELNVYFVAGDPDRTASDVEGDYLEVVAAVAGTIAIPLAVKVSPYFSSFAHMAARIVEAGAQGLVLFNRFYQPDLDLETLDVEPRIELSHSFELRLPLRWIATLRDQLTADLAATSGIHDANDVLKALLVGADVTMMTSTLLSHGPEHVRTVEEGVVRWMAEREYESVTQLRGSVSRGSSRDPSAFERANYLRTLSSYSPPSASRFP
jgi:dihydroorotate dehydrogenase (fumarate)